jgi:hypothetical protein
MSVLSLVSPPSPTLFLCLCLSLLLLAVVSYVCRPWTSPTSDEKETRDNVITDSAVIGLMAELGKWSWSWHWEGIPLSLPLSLSPHDSEGVGGVIGKGVGEVMKTNWQLRQSRPGFERPREWIWALRETPLTCLLVPALYESNVPLSMAKIIIARQVRPVLYH